LDYKPLKKGGAGDAAEGEPVLESVEL